ncbi:MAG: hypothetical protein V7788_16885 [Alphaproteobacteria bacterium]
MICSACGSSNIGNIETRKPYQCKECRHQFTQISGTICHGAHLELKDWFMGMMVQTGRTYHSNDNSFAERPFGRLQWDVLNFEGGYVGSGPGEMPGYDPKAATRLTPNDLQGVLTRYYVDEYPLSSGCNCSEERHGQKIDIRWMREQTTLRLWEPAFKST